MRLINLETNKKGKRGARAVSLAGLTATAGARDAAEESGAAGGSGEDIGLGLDGLVLFSSNRTTF